MRLSRIGGTGYDVDHLDCARALELRAGLPRTLLTGLEVSALAEVWTSQIREEVLTFPGGSARPKPMAEAALSVDKSPKTEVSVPEICGDYCRIGLSKLESGGAF